MSAVWIPIALAAAWVAFAYAGYPAALWLLARIAPREIRRGGDAPALSVVIAVHNGGAALRRKLEATLALKYPRPFQVIVASDGSTDDTDAVAASFADRGVELVRNPERSGKEAAQARAIERARGDVLVFTDVGAELDEDALVQIARPFADPSVGCASSEDRVDEEGGEGAYVRYEMALRRLESRATSLIGLSGSCFAARADLCRPWPSDLASDFRTALEAARRGLRAVSEPGARARIRAISDPGREWTRKVRTVRRGIAVLSAYRDLLSPRAGRVALTLWGHKVARFTSPLALVAMLVLSAVGAAAGDGLAQLLLAAQLAGYGLGAAALFHAPLARALPLRLAAFFLLVNASICAAWAHHLRGHRAVTWAPTER